MSPLPRNLKYRDTHNRKPSNLQTILLVLLSVQIILTIGMWIDLHDSSPSERKTSVVSNETVEQTKSGSVLNEFPETDPNEIPHVYTEPEINLIEEKVITSPPIITPAPIRLQILNGCGVGRVAAKLDKWMSNKGSKYNIIEVDNADRTDYRDTIILDRTGKADAAKTLADRLGISHTFIQNRPNLPANNADLTIIIGNDYTRLNFVQDN